MNDDKVIIETIENHLISSMGSYIEFIGGKTLLGRIFGLLISKSKPMSLKEISERLQISKPAVSTTLNQGLHSSLFKKVYIPEYPRENFFEIGIDYMETMVEPGITKLRMLQKSFEKPLRILSENFELVTQNKSLEDLEKRLDYLNKAFDLLINEYILFSINVSNKLIELRKENDLYS